ncbi:EF-hand domain-containing protein [Dongia mobilis]|uniref:EF-hand domain-containing protein n=1 Tax=Dongia sp. TaxID=1977262 RepID=UPI0026ED89D1
MKKSNRLMLLSGVVGLMLTAVTTAFAEMGPWADADANKDGSIDRTEFDDERAVHFKNLDTDADGLVTDAEMQAFRDAHHAEMEGKHGDMSAKFLKRFDTDSDGKVTEAEWPKDGRMTFAEVDTNTDGAVTAEELGNMRKMRDGKPGDGKDGFARLDTDKDGKVSAAEWNTLGDKMFARLDDNKDGKIAEDELPKHGKHGKKQPGVEPVLP